MRKLKLQMRMTLDGFVADPNGQLDWMTVGLDEKVMEILRDNANTSDTIIMGRKMSPAFLRHWESVVDSHTEGHDRSFAKSLVNTQKIIFSKTEKTTSGRNARMENGDLKTVVEDLKRQSGKDILTYGGATFATALIKENLVDEFYFLVVPATLGEGMRVFHERLKLNLIDSTRCSNGVVVNHYKSF